MKIPCILYDYIVLLLCGSNIENHRTSELELLIMHKSNPRPAARLKSICFSTGVNRDPSMRRNQRE